MAKAKKAGWEDFHVTVEDGKVHYGGEIRDPAFTRQLLAISRKFKITPGEAFELMLSTGAKIQNKATPVDGSTQHG